MTKIPGYRFTEDEASEIVKPLQECIKLLSGTIDFVDNHCDDDVKTPYKMKMAELIFDLGWEVLEQGFYKKYPELRPEDSVLREK